MKVVAKVHIMVGVYFYILPCREKKIEYEEYSHVSCTDLQMEWEK